MNRAKARMLVVAGLLLGAPYAWATTPNTVVVGTCRPKMPNYATISAAVALGGTVMVCPGSYAEQIVISTPLTLEGISNGNADLAVITVPSGGLSTSFTNIFGGAIVAQVLVTTGPVNISNITVDGTGNGVSGQDLAGVAYESGSSGTVNEVTVRNEIEGGSGNGIWAENGNTTNDSVTIENSSVHDFDETGIVLLNNQSPPTLTVTIKGNEVTGSVGAGGIFVNGAAGGVSGNEVGVRNEGIAVGSTSPVSITGNTVTGAAVGIEANDGNIVKANVVLNSTTEAIFLGIAGGSTVQSNLIGNSAIGIEFNCVSETVSGNTIRDTGTALSDVPLSQPLLANTYQDVAAIRSGGFCTAARTKALAAAAAAATAKRLAALGVH